MKNKTYVAYYRVSTRKQGQSQLGLDAQKNIVKTYCFDKGIIKAEFTEVESGNKKDRPQLIKALNYCKINDCTLVIAKLDRLTRSVTFVFSLRESGVNFVCCDIPQLNTLTLGMFATVAQYERELISKRTKAALAEKKRKGHKLGNPKNLTDYSRKISAKVRSKKARDNRSNQKAYAIIKDLRNQKLSYSKIAQKLNSYGLKTVRGCNFKAMTVSRIYKMYQTS